MPRNKSKKVYHHYPKSGVVKLPLFYLIVGILTLPFFVFLLIMGLRESIGLAIPGGALTLLSLSIIIAAVNWRVTFDTTGFTYRNFFRISRHYSYDDVTAIHFDNTAIVYVGKKKISVEESYDNRDAFLHSLKMHARHAKRTEAKLFGGNVRNPEEFVFVFWFVYIGLLLILAMAFFSNSDLKETDLASVSAVISDYEIRTDTEGDEDLFLYAEGFAKPFRVWYPEDMKNLELLQSDIESGAVFTICYDKHDNTEEQVRTDGAVVQRLTSDSCTYLTLESMNCHNAETRTILLVSALIITVVWWGFAGLFAYITTHADRFPNAVRWFVKDSYIIRKNK